MVPKACALESRAQEPSGFARLSAQGVATSIPVLLYNCICKTTVRIERRLFVLRVWCANPACVNPPHLTQFYMA